MELLGLQPLGVRMRGGQLALDLLVGDDAALGGVTRNIRPGCSRIRLTTLAGSRSSTPTSDADKTVLSHPDARRAKAVAVEHRNHDGAVGAPPRRVRPTARSARRGGRRTPDGRVHVLVAPQASGIIISTACGRL